MSQLQVTGEAKIRDIQGPVVANSGVITALDGDASQYVRGDGTLADFPTSTGGGSSVSYYLNSSVSQGTIGGVAYRQLGKTPIAGAGTDIAISANGYVASYITDANDPALLEVPAGNFNCEFYFSVNNNTGNPFVYAEVYKYDGTTFTLLGTSVGVPEYINQGTVINPYYFAVPVASSVLSITDRIAIRIYVNVDGRTVTLHTENNHLCQVVTTFSKGLTTLNNLTRQVQFFGTGTSGTDFNIVSSVATHTFNIPNASAISRGFITNGVQTIAGNKTFSGQNTFEDINKYNLGILMSQSGGGSTSTGYTSFSAYGTNGVLIGTITQSNILTFNSTALRTYTFPDVTGTIALLEGTQTFSGAKTFSLGISAVGGIGFPETVGGSNYGGIIGSSSFFQIAAQNGSTILIKSSNNTNAITISTVGKVDFGSTIGNGTFTYTLPSATGTIALTSDIPSLTGYVPYTGATANVNLGTFDLTADVITGTTGSFASSGGSDSFAINHSSGSGIALNITKGGNGEGLYINKTSGSGNAATIVGNLGGTSATFSSTLGVTGALSGTSATFSGALTFANGGGNYLYGGALRVLYSNGTNTNNIYSGGVNGLRVINQADSAVLLSIADTGAATFSSSVTADGNLTLTNNRSVVLSNPGTAAGSLVFYNATTATVRSGIGSFYNIADQGNLEFLTGGTSTRMVITSGGNVGIGSSTFTFAAANRTNLVLNGTTDSLFEFQNGSSSRAYLYSNTDGLEINSVGSRFMQFVTNAEIRMRITSDGAVLVGASSAPSSSTSGVALQNPRLLGPTLFSSGNVSDNRTFIQFINANGVVGSISTSGTLTSYNITSDYRLKQDFKDFNGLDLVFSIKTYDYEWKADNKRMYGVIAHELAEVLPYAVHGEKDAKEMQSVDYSKLVPIMVKAIQELKLEIEQLKNK